VSTDTSARLASRAARSAWTGLDWIGLDRTGLTKLDLRGRHTQRGRSENLERQRRNGRFLPREELQPAGRAVVLRRPEMLLIRAS